MRIDIAQLEFIDIKLRNILVWLEAETGHDYTVTSLFRMDDEGVHGQLPLRATDLRERNQNVGEELVKLINAYWQYDPERPSKVCALLHGKGSNLHIHLQSHHNTTERA